jgi:hypothetical protein
MGESFMPPSYILFDNTLWRSIYPEAVDKTPAIVANTIHWAWSNLDDETAAQISPESPASLS